MKNHEEIQSILKELVNNLEEASKDKEPSKFVPALETAINRFTKLLPKMKLQLLFEAIEGIIKETCDLEKALSTSPNGDKKEVSGFIEKRLGDIMGMGASYDAMKGLLQVNKMHSNELFLNNI